MDIKPIETEYNGYRFRSRLEARWAVFFDLAKIKWQYEVDGYVLEDGIKYLPDFYLPEFQLYVEVKHEPTIEERKDGTLVKWADKCSKFRTSVGSAILLVFGDPATDVWGRLYAWSSSSDGGGEFSDYARFMAVGNESEVDRVVVISFCNKADEDIFVKEWEINKNVISLSMMPEYYWEEARTWLAGTMHITFNEKAQYGSFNWMRKKQDRQDLNTGSKDDG